MFYTIIDYLTRDNKATSMNCINDISFDQGHYGYGAAMAWLYFLVVAVILAVLVAILKFQLTYQREQ